MKKKIIKISCFICIIVGLVYQQSCKRDILSEKLSNNYSYGNDTLFASIGTAISVAENVNKGTVLLQMKSKANLKSTKYFGKRTIKDYVTVWDKNNKDPYFHVVNYDSGGYVVISADKRLIPIIGYCDVGHFNKDSLFYGLAKWFNANASLIQYLRTSGAKQTASVSAQWSNLQCDNPPVKSTAVQQCPPPTPPSTSETTVTVGPLTTTTWDQGSNYNTYCPTLYGGPGGFAWAGCSTVAIAQVMAYWKYPSTYNWNSMSLYYGNDAVAKLIGDIFPNVISSYSTGGSGCSNDYNIVHTFSKFNYSSASLAGNVNGIVYNGDYHWETVVSNLNLNEPVILGGYDNSIDILGFIFPDGTGHTWVCDGYMQTTQYQNGVETAQYLLYHMNWGWNGSCNAWYYFDSWATSNGNYQYCKDIIYNIHP